MGFSALVLIVAALGAVLYEHLNGNITGVPIFGGGQEKPDAFGRTSINVLVIGSDARATAADCKLGGACGEGGANGDVEMVVHVSADRSNATVMSVPRDTVTPLPACIDSRTGQSVPAQTGMINSALSHGPACQVAAVHELTGIPIDHFIMVDFEGVVNMTSAIGGVPLCVSDNVYDTYSHLKLSKGTHVLKGVSALQFLRSRHGFGDGGDLGRTVGQHIYLSSMLRTLKSAGTLTDPGALYGLADAATKALTVDTGLDSVPRLLGLAADMNKVPPSRITFTTMQTMPDPVDTNRLVIAPSARSLLDAISNDQALTTGSGPKLSASTSPSTAAASPTAAVPVWRIAVIVQNGDRVPGRASAVAGALVNDGFSKNTQAVNAPTSTAGTTVRYPPGHQAEAQAVAGALRIPASHLHQDGAAARITVVIGADWTSGSNFPDTAGGSSQPAPANTKAAVAGANARTADQPMNCAQVSTFKTVIVNGVPMTPSTAYAQSAGVPDSAP
jgi:LCP family protein required for cell wall assembly